MGHSISDIQNNQSNNPSEDKIEFKPQIIWLNASVLFLLHISTPYGIYLAFTSAKMYTNMFALVLYLLTTLGITIGSHRLWSHRSYKANMPLQMILMILQTMSFQGSALHWARDHRLHHKYSETNADPHNAQRGLFFAQLGWLMYRKHPDVIAKGKGICMDDLRANPLVMFQHKYFMSLGLFGAFIVPTIVPIYAWNEHWANAFFVAAVIRWVWTLAITGFVNSLAHTRGPRPYDGTMNATDRTSISVMTLGEGYHNFHHAFPWDYRTGEIGKYNVAAVVIDFLSSIGWAYDLKSVSMGDLKKRVARTGDGSHNVWGGGCKDEAHLARERAKWTRAYAEREY